MLPVRPQLMVVGGRVLSEDGQGHAVTGPMQYLFYIFFLLQIL